MSHYEALMYQFQVLYLFVYNLEKNCLLHCLPIVKVQIQNKISKYLFYMC